MRKGRLHFSDFLKVILDFHLNEHLDYLREFIMTFRKVDLSCTAVVNEQQFRRLIKKMMKRCMDQQNFLPNDEKLIDRIHSLQLLQPMEVESLL